MICPEKNCYCREECKESNGHAKTHARNKHCDIGCSLHAYTNDAPNRQKHRCVEN